MSSLAFLCYANFNKMQRGNPNPSKINKGKETKYSHFLKLLLLQLTEKSGINLIISVSSSPTLIHLNKLRQAEIISI